ncbi:MAG TPA: M60 family metallopeptidase [Cellulomonas sp.]
MPRTLTATLLALVLAGSGLGAAGTAGPAAADTVEASTGSTTPLLTHGDDSTEVLVRGQGAASAASDAEDRQYNHSDLQPTGRFVHAGDVLTFDIASADITVMYAVAASGSYSDLNDGVPGSNTPTGTVLPVGESTVTAQSDGLVSLISLTLGGEALVRVTGGEPQPVHVLGETTQDELTAQLDRWDDSRFVLFVGKRIFAEMQRSEVDTVRSEVATWDPEVMVTCWDQVVSLAAAAHGLSDDAVGVAHKWTQRMRAVNPDTGLAWASATGGVITFQVGSGAGQDLLRVLPGTNSWGVWHEVGHTFQNPEYRWEDMNEVQVNLYSAQIQSQLGISTRYTATSGAVQAAQALFAQPLEERSRSGSSHELMFEQLRHAFGDTFWSRVNQQYRIERAAGRAEITDDDEKVQHFIRTASAVADRDLSEFFRQWGMPADETTLAAVADLPAPTRTIWDTLVPADMVEENVLPAYVVPTAVLGDPDDVLLGQTTLPDAADLVLGLGSVGGTSTTRVIGSGVTTSARDLTGTVWVLLENDHGVRDLVATTATVLRGNGLTFGGLTYGDSNSQLVLALEPGTGTLYTWSRGVAVHPNFSGELFLSLELRTADGATVVSGSVEGQETADAIAAAFSGVPYQDGRYLLVTHAEPSKLSLDVDGVLQANRTTTEQAFRIQDGRLVLVDASEVPQPTAAELTSVDLAQAQAGVAYTQTLTASGAGPITFTADGLPAGMSLEQVGTHEARIVGTPTEAGTAAVTVTVTGAVGQASSTTWMLVVDPAVASDPDPQTDPEPETDPEAEADTGAEETPGPADGTEPAQTPGSDDAPAPGDDADQDQSAEDEATPGTGTDLGTSSEPAAVDVATTSDDQGDGTVPEPPTSASAGSRTGTERDGRSASTTAAPDRSSSSDAAEDTAGAQAIGSGSRVWWVVSTGALLLVVGGGLVLLLARRRREQQDGRPLP